jgi:2-oxoisovalerate dehydrogenase E1 component
MHLFAPEIGLMGTSGIVGPCILQAAGAGYSFKLLKTDRVAVAFFGDGAVNNGAFHEGLNMAGIWRLPVVFVCENNGFATEVPFRYASGNPSVASRGAAYGIPGVEVDGNDVGAVAEAAGEAALRARSGGGSTLIECKTYRTRPHSEGMGDYTYRTREEVAAWRERCPIQRLRAGLLEKGLASDAALSAIDAEIRAAVTAASQTAENAPWPDAGAATKHVYCEAESRDRSQDSKTGDQDSGVSPAAGAREISFVAATLANLGVLDTVAQGGRHATLFGSQGLHHIKIQDTRASISACYSIRPPPPLPHCTVSARWEEERVKFPNLLRTIVPGEDDETEL